MAGSRNRCGACGVTAVTGEPLTGLAELYATIGQDQYRWRDFGPDRDTMQFHYYSFDPKGKRPWQPDASHIEKTGHLLIEAGGFDQRHPKGWETPWLVLAKAR